MDLDDVEFLLQINFSVVKISKILGVSRSTIYRRLEENGRCIQKYSLISNDLLDVEVGRICREFPHDGEVMISGHLVHRGIHVTRAKLRASIHHVDPQGVASRSMHTIKRRMYHVPFANYVWHLDSHHKLIRWRIVTHAAIDGYSRKILMLHVQIIIELTLFYSIIQMLLLNLAYLTEYAVTKVERM